jgi:alanyl-tRNA synthetase
VTTRIYYTDPSCRSFEAVVTRAFSHEGRPAVTLDRTAFYPTSGGQPFDTGQIGEVSVLETVDADDVLHVVSAPLAEGATVKGEIDWTRRFDHMQQHTGQHLLSAAFDRLFDNQTVGFHMGAEVSTIDLARDAPVNEIECAVDEANRIVWENRPVSIRFVSQGEAQSLKLRKDPAREGTLRLIDVSAFDLSACGGTHVDRTGAVGIIAVAGWERQRGGSRLTFVCGGRALRLLRTYRNAVAGSIRTLSVLPADLPAAIERMQGEAREARKHIKELQEQLAAYEGGRLVAAAAEVRGVRLVVEVLAGWDAAGLKAVATAAVSSARACAVLLSDTTPLSIVVACSRDVGIDASAVLRQLVERHGGRGGGKPDLAQAGGLAGPPQEVAAAARAAMAARLEAG